MATITATRHRIPVGTIVLVILVGLGLVAAVMRFLYGFGAMTNLGDGRPWGLWISFDLLCGVALSAGAFVIAGTVHILHLEKYRPVLRPALLTGFLGYLLVIVTLLVDLGVPYRIWHMLVYQNLHSPLFEVGMCVMFYTSVLALEVSPIVFRKLNWQRPLQIVKAATIPLVIAGIVLSTMHQSSLGSLFLIMPFRVHPLWYTPLIPLIFLVSAIAAGLGMVIFECSLCSRVFGRDLHLEAIQGLGRALFFVLGLLLLIKLGDLAIAGELGLMFDGSAQGNMFLLENGLGIILPIVLLSVPRFRRSAPWLFRIGLLTVLGLMLHRFNVSLNGMAGAPYSPHWMELAVTFGIVSAGLLAFGLAVCYLPVEEEAG